jgi:hypothetical protein
MLCDINNTVQTENSRAVLALGRPLCTDNSRSVLTSGRLL